MQRGFYFLDRASNKDISVYHILAAISAYHCTAANFESTDWASILSLYNKLLQLDNSPVVLLNRSIALAKVSGPKKAIEELQKLNNTPSLKSYHLFYSTLAEFYMESGKFTEAASCLKTAISLSPLKAEMDLLQRKLEMCIKK